jgi:hypothetical protein
MYSEINKSVGGAATTDLPAIENNKTNTVVTVASLNITAIRCILYFSFRYRESPGSRSLQSGSIALPRC